MKVLASNKVLSAMLEISHYKVISTQLAPSTTGPVDVVQILDSVWLHRKHF